MSSISRELQITLQAAVREAIARRHAYVTVEHLLYALLHDEQGREEAIRSVATRAARAAWRRRRAPKCGGRRATR